MGARKRGGPAGKSVMHRRPQLILVLAVLWVSSAFWGRADGSPMTAVERTVLSNGLVILVSEEHSLPSVTFQLLLEAGSRFDPPGREGLANLTAKSILLGTATLTASQINERLDFFGASLSTTTSKDFMTMVLTILKKDLDKGFGLFLETLIRPVFPVDEVTKEIQRTIGLIKSEEDKPAVAAKRAFEKALFMGNPYGHPVKGTPESLIRLAREAVLRFHKNHYLPNKAILAITGDITAAEVRTGIVPKLESWQKGNAPLIPFQETYFKGPTTIRINRVLTQANILIGSEGISRSNPDFYALTVMNYILGGGGFNSRLLQEIRGKRGLAYSVSSAFDAPKYPGSFQIELQTKNASAGEAISVVIGEMKKIQKDLVSEKEIGGAKKYLIGNFPLRIDTQAKLANFLVQAEYYGLGPDYPQRYPSLISAVTREDVQRAAKRYLNPDDAVVVIVGNMKEARFDTPVHSDCMNGKKPVR